MCTARATVVMNGDHELEFLVISVVQASRMSDGQTTVDESAAEQGDELAPL